MMNVSVLRCSHDHLENKIEDTPLKSFTVFIGDTTYAHVKACRERSPLGCESPTPIEIKRMTQKRSLESITARMSALIKSITCCSIANSIVHKISIEKWN